MSKILRNKLQPEKIKIMVNELQKENIEKIADTIFLLWQYMDKVALTDMLGKFTCIYRLPNNGKVLLDLRYKGIAMREKQTSFILCEENKTHNYPALCMVLTDLIYSDRTDKYYYPHASHNVGNEIVVSNENDPLLVN